MQVSPVDIQAWASETGSEYPATPAEKAAVLPAVAAWKAEQLADARASRGQNAISPIAAGIGAAGLGLAGLIAFNHYRKQGLSEPAAAAMAKVAENQAAATPSPAAAPAAPPPPAAAPAPAPTTAQGPLRAVDPEDTNVRVPGNNPARSYTDPATGQRRTRPGKWNGPNLRGNREDGPTAATLDLSGRVSKGSTLAHQQGQYVERSDKGFHDPTIAQLDTPEKREIYLAAIADANGTDSKEFRSAQALIASLETTTPGGVEPTSFINGLAPKDRYGTETEQEQAAAGRHLNRSRTKSNASAQAGYQARDAAIQRQALTYSPQARANQQLDALYEIANGSSPGDMGATSDNNGPLDPEVLRQRDALDTGKGNIKAPKPSAARRPNGVDPKLASVFFEEPDGSYKTYLGSDVVLGPGKSVISTGKRSDNTPIAWSDMAYYPVDNPDFYIRSGLDAQGQPVEHPFLTRAEVEDNFNALPDQRFATEEDQGIKGMLEGLPSSDPRFSTGVRKDGATDNWVFGRVGTSDVVPVNAPPLQADKNNPALFAAARLRQAVADHHKQTGKPPAPEVQKAWAADLAREFAVHPTTVLRAAAGRGEMVPLDLSGFQSEATNPTALAAGRFRTAVKDYFQRTGDVPSPGVQRIWATDLARQHSVDPINVLNTAKGVKTTRTGGSRPLPQARALSAGLGDALDRIYNSLGMHAGADAWDLDQMVRSGNIRGAAEAFASQLPALTAVNSGGLRGASQDEKLNIVAEGIGAGLKDLAITLAKNPASAEKFGIGRGAGGFGVDAYLKSYVRDWVTVRGLQLDPTGQPTYQVPNDAFELIAHKAHQAGHSTLHELENHIRGAANGLEGALRIDRMVSAAQSTKEASPNANATNFAQAVFDSPDPDLLSTTLTNEAAGDIKLSFGTRREYDATAGFYSNKRQPGEQAVGDAIDDYETSTYSRNLDDIDSERYADAYNDAVAEGDYNIPVEERRLNYGLNATLNARIKGADYATPEGRAAQQAAKDAQAWITANANSLERARADLNRGVLQTENGPVSFGRGVVIASRDRGAFLTGDTQGINTSISEERDNDLDATPIDRAEDYARDDATNNLIVQSDEVEPADDRLPVTDDPTDRTVREYGATELHFKNLGPNSEGAMDPGEAFEPRRRLRRYMDEKKAFIKAAGPRAAWQAPQEMAQGPNSGVDFESRLGGSVERDTKLVDLNPHQRAGGRAAQGDEWRDARKYGVAPTLNSDPRWFADGFTGGGTSAEEAAAIAASTAEARELTAGRHRSIAFNPEGQPIIVDGQRMVQGPRRPPASFETGGAIDPYASYGDKGVTSDPRPQITDLEQLSALVGQTPRAAVQPEFNTETAARHRAALEARAVGGGEAFRDDQQLREASDRSLLDRGEVGGLGRRGSTFPQKPIAAAPVSSLPAAAQEQLNTLRSSMEPSVDAVARAKAGHIADYMDKLAAGGLRTSADGKRLLFNSQRKVGAYTEPGDAMVAARINGLRKRGII